jgi:hypothetical protein
MNNDAFVKNVAARLISAQRPQQIYPRLTLVLHNPFMTGKKGTFEAWHENRGEM